MTAVHEALAPVDGEAFDQTDYFDTASEEPLLGTVPEARVVFHALQSQVDSGGLNAEDPDVQETAQVVQETLNRRIIDSMGNAALSAIDKPVAVVADSVTGTLHFVPLELEDLEDEDDAVMISADELFADDESKDPTLDFKQELLLARQHPHDAARIREEIEAARTDSIANRQLLIEQNEHAGEVPLLTATHIAIAATALQRELKVVPPEDPAKHQELYEAFLRFDRVPAGV